MAAAAKTQFDLDKLISKFRRKNRRSNNSKPLYVYKHLPRVLKKEFQSEMSVDVRHAAVEISVSAMFQELMTQVLRDLSHKTQNHQRNSMNLKGSSSRIIERRG